MRDERVLELTDATVVKNGFRILDGLTLSIRDGQHTAIVGPNGSGKSTLMNVLTQQDHPLARNNGVPPVLVFGESLMDLFDLRLRIGIVTADLHQRFVGGNSTSPRLYAGPAMAPRYLLSLNFLKRLSTINYAQSRRRHGR